MGMRTSSPHFCISIFLRGSILRVPKRRPRNPKTLFHVPLPEGTQNFSSPLLAKTGVAAKGTAGLERRATFSIADRVKGFVQPRNPEGRHSLFGDFTALGALGYKGLKVGFVPARRRTLQVQPSTLLP